ncbi:hypothetical protein HMI55_003035 [Coelomomyces lativittatus]|nr:hypothetical protein HMI55_003035 [Coelomomyces lativittatus]
MVNKEWAWIGSESLAPLLYFLKEHPIEEYHRELLLTNGLMLLFPCPIPSTDLVLQLQSTYPDMNGAQLMGTHALLFRECFLSMAEGIVGISSKIQHENLISGNYNISTSDFRAFHEQNANRSEIHARFHVKGYTILNLYNGDMRPAYQLNVAEDYFEQIDFPRFHDGSSEIPYYKRRLPERYLHPHHPGVIGMLCVLALLMLSFNLVAAYLCVHRNHPSVKCTSYPFLFLITAGITLCLSSIVLLVDKPTSTTCNLRIWVFLMGLQLMLSSIAAKAYRIWLIFDNTMLARIDYLSNPYLFKGCSFILFFQAVVLLIITLTSPLEPSPIETSTAIYYRCQAKPIEIDLALRSVCVLLVAIMLTATVLLAHKTRTAATAFCETNYILYTAQNVFVCALVTVPLEFVDLKEFVLSATIIHIIMVLFGAVATFWMLVGRIAWQVYKEQRNQSGPFAPSALDSQWPLPMSLGRHPGVTMKHAAVTGMFPIKAGHRFLATWHHSNLLLFPLEGYLGILPTKQAWSKGRLFKLRTIVFEVPEKIQLCIKLIIGPSIFLIQFHNSLEFDAWMQLFRVHCNYRPDMEPTPTFLPTTASGIRYRTQTFGSYSTKYQFPWSQPKPFESTTALNFTSEQNKNVKSAQDTTSTTKGPLEKPEE